jgi:hypothetical protein
MHTILVIPALAWLCSFTHWGENRQLNVVRLGTAGYGLLSIVVIVEAATHTAPLSAPPLAMVVSGLGLAVLLTAGALGLLGVLLRPHAART